MSQHHYLSIAPLVRQPDGGRSAPRWTVGSCWLERFDAVALGCACGWRGRLLTAADLDLARLDDFYGDPSDEALDRLTREVDLAHMVNTLDPTVLNLQAPTEALEGAGERVPV